MAASVPFNVLRAARPLIAALGVAALAACGHGGDDTQIAARVNKGEISVHQVQTLLQRQGRPAGGEASARVLETLIDQELAAQAATDAGLDKDPAFVQQLAAARRELLARAYQERVAAKAVTPSTDEVERYFEAHPELFAQRRLYVLRETLIDPAADATVLRAAAERARSPEDLDRLLREAGLRFATRLTTSASEDLPAAVLGPVSKLEPGQSVAVLLPGVARAYTVIQAIRAPVDRHNADPLISGYITNERRAAAVGEAMKTLRAEGRISYVGNFAPGAASAASAPARREGTQ